MRANVRHDSRLVGIVGRLAGRMVSVTSAQQPQTQKTPISWMLIGVVDYSDHT